MAAYRIVVKDKAGNAIGEFDRWDTLKFGKKLNGVGELSFAVPANDTKLRELTALRSYEVFLYRDNTLVWGGELAHRSGALSANGPNWVALRAFDFLELLNHRYTGSLRTFAATDAGQIAWTLIDESQDLTDGDYGITQGTIEATKDRDRTYETKNVMEAIIQLSEVLDGFDFEVTDQKVFNVHARKGSDLAQSIVLEWGSNLESATIEEDFTHPVNEAIVLGSGFGSSQARATYTDSTARGIHKLRQARVSYTDVLESETLTDKGTAVVDQYKQPVLSLQLTQFPGTEPVFGSLTTGDVIRVVIAEGIYDIDYSFRVYGWNVGVDREGRESIEYLVSSQL